MADGNSKNIVKNKGGRPTVMSADTITKLESIFKIGGTVDEAVTYAGIGRRTYFDHLERDEAFRTKIEAAQHYADIVAKNVVIDAIVKDKDLNTAKWWLEKRQFNQPIQQNNMTQINVGSKEGNVINFVNFKNESKG